MKYRNYYCIPKYSDGDKCYYGSVEGAPEISTIGAENLDDFERLFHDAVDDYLSKNGNARSSVNWGRIFSGGLVFILLLTMVLTCPKKDQHVEAITNKFASALTENIDSNNAWSSLGSLFGKTVAKPILKYTVTVDDYVLFSVGKITLLDESEAVSLGILGHVFVANP